MTNNKINFKQERDFGELFNATFSFISQEFKRLATAILYFVVPLLLLSAIAMTIYMAKAQEITQSFVPGAKPDPLAVFSVMGSLAGYIGIAILISLLASSVLFSTVYGYIKLYNSKGSEGFSLGEVWIQVTQNFLRIFLALILMSIVIIIGAVFCLLPGIYLSVALSIVLCIMMFEGKSFGESFGRSIKLINKSFWQTLGALFIVMVLVYILIILVSVPSMVFGLKSLISNVKHPGNPMMNFSMTYIIVNSITQLFSQIFITIPIILTAFIYYSVVEKVEKPSLLEKIDQMNENE